MALFTDAFTRADANLASGGDSWTQVDGTAGWGAVRSNKLACLTSDAAGAAYQCPDTGSMQHYAQARLATITDPSGPFLCCRLQDRNNFIGVRYDSSAGKLEAYRRNAGTLTSLVPATITCAVNDVIKLQVDSGSVWTIYKNGVLADTGNSGSGLSSLTSTRAGVVMRAVATNPWIDDFEANSWGAVGGGGIDFPSSPTVGQLFAPAGTGITYLWNGTGWTAITPAYSGCYKISSGGPTVTNLSTIDIDLPAGYSLFELMLASFTTISAGSFYIAGSVDGTTFPSTHNYVWNATVSGSPAVNQTNSAAADGGWQMGTPTSSASNRLAGMMTIPVVSDPTQYQPVFFRTGYAAGQYVSLVGEGTFTTAGLLKKLRLFFGSGGTIASGAKWQLNGWK